MGDSKFSESSSLYPELASDVTSLSGSASILGVMVGPSIGRAQFEFLLLLPMASGVAVLGVEVSVSALAARAVPAQSGKLTLP